MAQNTKTAWLVLALCMGIHCKPEPPPSPPSAICPKADPSAYPIRLTSDSSTTIALFSDGTARCWGLNSAGECGVRPSPVKPTTLTNLACASEISRGGDGGALLRFDGQVAVWSANRFGELGDGGQKIPVAGTPELIPGVSGIVHIASGVGSEYAIQADGTLLWWGRLNILPPLKLNQASPEVLPGLPLVKQVSSRAPTCAVTLDEQVWCWGDNRQGELGDGTTTSRIEPAPVPGIDQVVEVGAGASFTCALERDGSVWCWGYNDQGQLGRGDPINTSPNHPPAMSTTPARVVGLPPIQSIGVGREEACGVDFDGTPYCWGSTFAGTTSTPRPEPGLDHVLQISPEGYHLCALKADHTVWCEGEILETGTGTTELAQVMFN